MKSIKILGEVHKFETITYPLDENNYFSIDRTNLIFNGEVNTSCLLKTLEGNINNETFNFESLIRETPLKNYLEYRNTVNFINECSLRINKKKYFNFNTESQTGISVCDSSSINELIDNDKHRIIPNKLWETCIIPIDKKVETFDIVPIYFYNGSMKYKNTPVITILEIVINILSKKFPSFKVQLHKLATSELNISNIKNESFEERVQKSNEELLLEIEQLKKENELLKIKNKSNSYEETEKLYDKYMNESELFRNEVKRYLIETQKQFIDSYIEGSKIKIIDSFKSNSRSTSSIELGDSGENYVKDLLNELKIKYEDTSGTAYQSDIHIKDEVNKIIYILEVKNRSSIPRSEITKFNRDIENITKLNQDYTIVPLFISLSNSNINESKGKFNITDNVTYITLPYVTKETLQMFFELNRNNIKYIQKIKILKKYLKKKQN